MMISAVRQTDSAFEPPWKQVGGSAAAGSPGTSGPNLTTVGGPSAQQNSSDQGKLSVAYTELSELQQTANLAMLGGNPARAMEAAMEATQIASSIRDLVGSAPAVSVGSIQLATDQLAQMQKSAEKPAPSSETSGESSLLPWQTAAANAALSPFAALHAGETSEDEGSDGGTSLDDALKEALAAIASVHLDTRA